MVKKFEEFINEELNFTNDESGLCKFEDRWFYYKPDDDIIFGCDEKPVDEDYAFIFNPKTCVIYVNGKEVKYDINNPVCLITWDIDKSEIKIYKKDAIKYLNELGFVGDDIINGRNKIQDLFEDDDDVKHILISGDIMVASTFDVIEEN